MFQDRVHRDEVKRPSARSFQFFQITQDRATAFSGKSGSMALIEFESRRLPTATLHFSQIPTVSTAEIENTGGNSRRIALIVALAHANFSHRLVQPALLRVHRVGLVKL